MSTDIVSRWPIVMPVSVQAGDCDDDGRLTDAGAERMFALARERYFDLCTTVDTATVGSTTHDRGARFGGRERDAA